MFSTFPNLYEFLTNEKTSFNKAKLKEIVQNYTFLFISNDTSLNDDQKQKIVNNIKHSKVIVFDQKEKLNEETNQSYLIIEKTLIILEQSSKSAFFLYDYFNSNSKLSFCLLSNTKSLVNTKISLQNR